MAVHRFIAHPRRLNAGAATPTRHRSGGSPSQACGWGSGCLRRRRLPAESAAHALANLSAAPTPIRRAAGTVDGGCLGGNGAVARPPTTEQVVLDLREVERLRPFETALGEHLSAHLIRSPSTHLHQD